MLLFPSMKGITGQKGFSNLRTLNSFSLHIVIPEKAQKCRVNAGEDSNLLLVFPYSSAVDYVFSGFLL